MKTILLFSFTLILNISYSQSTLIPDPNFEQALIDLNIDSDGLNGSILNSDAEQFTYPLDVSSRNISSLSGIEAFENITSLDCSFNNLFSLNLSLNTNLVSFSARDNHLSELNIDNLGILQSVNIENNLLDSLDFSNHLNLNWLMCFSNKLTYLNISENFNLIHLSCGENQLSGNIDISNLNQLEFFSCRKNQLSNIQLGMFGNIEIFNCQNNNITNLDLSNYYSLKYIYADSNELETLNIKNYANNVILEFHAEGNPNLDCIQVDNETYSTNNPNWVKDSHSNYSQSCDWAELIEIESSAFTLAPNPTTNLVVLKSNTKEEKLVEIYDLNGKLLLSELHFGQNSPIDIRHLSTGSYLIKVGQKTEKLVKY